MHSISYTVPPAYNDPRPRSPPPRVLELQNDVLLHPVVCTVKLLTKDISPFQFQLVLSPCRIKIEFRQITNKQMDNFLVQQTNMTDTCTTAPTLRRRLHFHPQTAGSTNRLRCGRGIGAL